MLSSRRDGRDVYDIWTLDTAPMPWPRRRHGEAKRLIQQGGVKVNQEKIDSQDLDVSFDPPILVQVGKRSFVEIV